MSKQGKQNSWLRNYGLLICMLVAIVAGCVVGFLFPAQKERPAPRFWNLWAPCLST